MLLVLCTWLKVAFALSVFSRMVGTSVFVAGYDIGTRRDAVILFSFTR